MQCSFFLLSSIFCISEHLFLVRYQSKDQEILLQDYYICKVHVSIATLKATPHRLSLMGITHQPYKSLQTPFDPHTIMTVFLASFIIQSNDMQTQKLTVSQFVDTCNQHLMLIQKKKKRSKRYKKKYIKIPAVLAGFRSYNTELDFRFWDFWVLQFFNDLLQTTLINFN